jgi:hypothetical protein
VEVLRGTPVPEGASPTATDEVKSPPPEVPDEIAAVPDEIAAVPDEPAALSEEQPGALPAFD